MNFKHKIIGIVFGLLMVVSLLSAHMGSDIYSHHMDMMYGGVIGMLFVWLIAILIIVILVLLIIWLIKEIQGKDKSKEIWIKIHYNSNSSIKLIIVLYL